MVRRGTVKYIAETVLMGLWAGARAKWAQRFLQKNLKPYVAAGRLVTLNPEHYTIGQLIAGLLKQHYILVQEAGFLNGINMAFMAPSIGAVLHMENRYHFEIIKTGLPFLKIAYLQNQ